MDAGVLRIGLQGALLLALSAVTFAVLGLTPALSWIPEVPLLIAAAAIPMLVLLWTGARAARLGGSVAAAAAAAALAGAIGGLVGGVAYIAYGKSTLNLAAGLLVGLVGGAAAGAAAGTIVLRTLRRPRDPERVPNARVDS